MLSTMAYDATKARKALQQVMEIHDLSERAVAKLARRSPSTITHFLRGRTDSLTSKTYGNLAAGFVEELGKDVSEAQLKGEAPIEIDLPVSTIIGAGDEVVEQLEGDQPFEWERAPPGMQEGEVTEVRGRSMLPAYSHGDRLFHRYMDPDPRALLGELVVAKLKDGRRFVKVLQAGSRKGRFTLASLNPAYPPMVDQMVEAAAKIVWVRKAQKPTA